MRAARAYEGEDRFRLEEIPIPELEPGDVLVKVEASGLTHGLLNLWRMRGRIKLLPAVLSQEIAGTVAEVANGTGAFKVGDRVRVHSTLSCRQCEHCQAGNEVWCDQVSLIGHAVYSDAALPLYERYHNGGLAEYVKVPEWSLDPLPEAVSFDLGAKTHSIAVTYQAMRRAGVKEGDVLLIAGATGAQGTAAIKLARAFGVGRVLALARTRRNLERTQALDPDLVEIIAMEELPEEWENGRLLIRQIKQMTRGRGPDVMLDFLPGSPAVTVQSIYSVRKGGSIVLVGGNWNEIPLLYGMVMNNGWEIRGSQGGARSDNRAVLDLIASGKVDFEPLLTDRFPLSDVNRGVELIDSRSGQPLLVVVNP